MNKKALLVMEEGSSTHWIYRIVLWGAFFAFALWLPHQLQDFRVGQLNHAIGLMVGVLGLNMLIGYSGLLALSHSAFIGLAAYVSGILIQYFEWRWSVTLIPALLACFVIGSLLGFPALRIKGLYLALVTLSLAVVFPTLLKMDVTVPILRNGELSVADYTGGANGLIIKDKFEAPSWLPNYFGGEEEVLWHYYFIAFVTLIMFVLANNMLRSRAGRAIIAVRDNETGAAVSGVNLPLYKTMWFGVSAVFAGVSGYLYLVEFAFVSDTSFSLNLAILLLAGLIVGGVGTVYGAIWGGLLIVFIPWWAADVGDGPWGSVVFGLLLIVLTFVMPGGIIAGVRKVKKYLVQIVPVAPDISGRGGPIDLSTPVEDAVEGAMEAAKN